MAILRPYSSRTYGHDFTVYFTEQVTNQSMRASFRDGAWMQFLIWTTERVDGVTICWVQTKIPVTRLEMETEYFPDATWIGTTDQKQEYDSWFKNLEGRDRYKFEGSFDNKAQHTDGMLAGRDAVLEILECVKAMRDWNEEEDGVTDTEEDGVGSLMRTQPRTYPAGGN